MFFGNVTTLGKQSEVVLDFSMIIVHQNLGIMNITFDELRRIKHALPSGSITRIAQDLNVDEQTVRNYFGAHNYKDGSLVDWHIEPGPEGGIVHIEDTTIYDRAIQLIEEHRVAQQ